MPALLTSTSRPPSFASSLREQPLHRGAIGDVATASRVIARVAGGKCRQRHFIDVAGVNLGAFGCEGARDRKPDAACAGGDQHAQTLDIEIRDRSEIVCRISAGETAARKDEIRGAADVGGNSAQRRGSVAGGDGLAHIGMKPDRVALRQPFGIGAQIEIDHRPGLEPEPRG